MPNLTQPTSDVSWTEGNTVLPPIAVAPSAQEREAGFVPGQGLPAEIFNYQLRELGRWIEYLRQETELVSNQNIVFDAFVGPSGTHEDLNAVMDDPNINNINNIYVLASLAVEQTQVITKDGINIHFGAQASITKSPTGPAVGLRIDSTRVRIINGRFSSFSSSGDFAIQLNGNNILLNGCFFNGNDNAINDQGTNNSFVANIEEV